MGPIETLIHQKIQAKYNPDLLDIENESNRAIVLLLVLRATLKSYVWVMNFQTYLEFKDPETFMNY